MNSTFFGNKPTTGNNNGIFNYNPGVTSPNNSMAGVNNIFNRNIPNSSGQGAPNTFGSTGAMIGGNMQSGDFGNFMANNSKPAETNRGIFGGSNNMQNQGGIFSGKTSGVNQQSTGIFNTNMPQQNNPSTNFFGSGQKNSFQTSQGIFNQNNQGGFFGANNNNTTTPFVQNNNNSSSFNQNNSPFNNNSNSPFGNTNNIQGQAYGMMANNNNNQLFQNNQGNTNVLGVSNQQVNQMDQNGQGGVLMAGNQGLQQQPYALQFSSFQVPSVSPLQNEMMCSTNSVQHTKLLLQELSKRISNQNLDDLKLHDSNIFSKVRISQLPFKQQLYTLIRNKRTLSKYIQKLQTDQIMLVNMNRQWSMSFGLKLARCKELALESIKNSKMINQVKFDIEEMERYICNFIKPLYNASLYKTGVSFVDPDHFCMQIARKILSRMRIFEQKVDDIISANNIQGQEAIDYLQVLSNLGQYFEQVAGQLKAFESRYHEMKRMITQKRLCGNLEESLRRGRENQQSNSQYSNLKMFEVLKQIQRSLVQREEALQRKSETLLKLNA